MSWADQEFIGPAQEHLYGLAAQDMPVGTDEVEEAINNYTQELLDALLFADLIEQHRPVIGRPSGYASDRVYAVYCEACNGNFRRIVLLPDDEIPECRYWTNAKKLGLVSDSPSFREDIRDEGDSSNPR